MACICCVRVVASARDPLVRSRQFLAGSASWSRALPERCGRSCSEIAPSSRSATGEAQSCQLPDEGKGAISEEDLPHLSGSARDQLADPAKNWLDLTSGSRALATTRTQHVQAIEQSRKRRLFFALTQRFEKTRRKVAADHGTTEHTRNVLCLNVTTDRKVSPSIYDQRTRARTASVHITQYVTQIRMLMFGCSGRSLRPIGKQ